MIRITGTNVKEETARITVTEGVFYNPKMKPLRDMSVAFLNALDLSDSKKSLLDSTSATGIRCIRYAKETGISMLTAIDINEKATNNTKKNLRLNSVKADVFNIDLEKFAAEHDAKFQIIDLDPFGSPSPYIRDILKLSEDGTIIMMTATDTAVLCGAHSKACVKQYGSIPLHNHLCKEAGIRILINHFIRKAAEFNFGTEVILSISDMHYMRIFLRLKKGAESAYGSMLQNGFGSYCNSCSAYSYASGIAPVIENKCKNCNSRTKLFGPLYLGRLNQKDILKRMLVLLTEASPAYKPIKTISEEYESPFFYHIPLLTRFIKTSSISFTELSESLRKKGFQSTRTLFDQSGIKTDAPLHEIISSIKKLRSYNSA